MKDGISKLSNREQMMQEATAWLLEMEMLDSPQLKNALILNIFSSSKYINDVNILIDTNYKVMLIYLKLKWLGRFLWRHKVVATTIMNMLQEVLPSFRVRVVFSEKIFNMALKKAEEMMNRPSEKKKREDGKKDDKPKTDSDNDGNIPTDSVTNAGSGTKKEK